MITLWIILIMVAYFAIGGLVAGIFNHLDNEILIVPFWPILLGMVLMFGIAYYPMELGKKLRKKWRR